MRTTLQPDLPALSNVHEIDAPTLPAFVAEQRQKGKRILTMTVVRNARYKVTTADDSRPGTHAMPPTTSRDGEAEPTPQSEAQRALGQNKGISLGSGFVGGLLGSAQVLCL